MKRIGHLFQRVVSLENIRKAEIKAQKGKKNYPEIKKWNERREDNIQEIYSSLQDKSYRPSGYVSFTIFEPKRREISKSPFRDRVVHHTIMNVLEPIYESIICISRNSVPYDSFCVFNTTEDKGKQTNRSAFLLSQSRMGSVCG